MSEWTGHQDARRRREAKGDRIVWIYEAPANMSLAQVLVMRGIHLVEIDDYIEAFEAEPKPVRERLLNEPLTLRERRNKMLIALRRRDYGSMMRHGEWFFCHIDTVAKFQDVEDAFQALQPNVKTGEAVSKGGKKGGAVNAQAAEERYDKIRTEMTGLRKLHPQWSEKQRREILADKKKRQGVIGWTVSTIRRAMEGKQN